MKKLKILISRLYSFIFRRNIILFESKPDFSDNTLAVFNEMIRRGINKSYKFLWLMEGSENPFNKVKNVICLRIKHTRISFWQRIRFKLYFSRTIAIICCNTIYPPFDCKYQKAYYLSHGMPIKSIKDYYYLPQEINYCLSLGEGLSSLFMKELKAPLDKIVSFGFPRNDWLNLGGINFKKYFEGEFEKVIIWYPTFRQHKTGYETGSNQAIPIISDLSAATELNEVCRKNNILIVLKPHFAQDLSKIKNLSLSHIRFIDDAFYKDNNIIPYQFVGSADALLTDFSSIYYDYLLCDKPIGLVWEDIEQYKQKPGLIDDYEYYTSGAEKIYELDELLLFVKRVANGEDILKAERAKLREEFGLKKYDMMASERVVDFICQESKIRTK